MRPLILFRGPVKTRSGYGAHARDLLESLYQMDLFDIKIDSCPWGQTPMNALDKKNTFHNWIESNIITRIDVIPDLYIQVTIPSEFRRFGKINIGVTAGIETTVAPLDWIEGCNRMDLIITTSTFSRDVLINTVYNENDKTTNQVIGQKRVNKPVSVLFEGVKTNVYNNVYDNFELNIKEDFAFIFVGHWLKGDLGQDRKDVGMLIKCFVEAFKDEENQPALILKTSSATFSIKDREIFKTKIKNLTQEYKNPPSIYLLFGDLTDEEMNSLYNHPKIKSMVSITKGEGFGRPLLEFSVTGKPIIASNWSGQRDFLPLDKAILIGGKIDDVHESAIDNFIIKGSKWFTANYNEFINVMKILKRDYDKFHENSQKLSKENSQNFSFERMTQIFKNILTPYLNLPKEKKLMLPELKKIQ